MKSIKKIIIATLLFQFASLTFSDSVYPEVSLERVSRFALWAQTDVYPGYFEEDTASKDEINLNKNKDSEVTLSVPIAKIKSIAPFLVEGMVYGWKFEYTPYDKKRNVQEYFDFKPIRELSELDKSKIKYEAPWVENDRLYAWVEYQKTENQINSYKAWNSIKHPRIKGIGYGKLTEGFDGIKKACEEALKNAVREYERTQIKSKPKEITGKVIISKEPLIGVSAGRYKIVLDFFMESDKIIEYKTF